MCVAANFAQAALAVAAGLDAGAVEAVGALEADAVATTVVVAAALALAAELLAGVAAGTWAAMDALLAVPAPAVHAVTDKPSAATAHADKSLSFNMTQTP